MDSRQILLVDDDLGCLEILVGLVDLMGCKAFPTTTQQEALDVSARDRLDLAIADRLLKDEDMHGFIQALRLRHSTLPVLIVSAWPHREGFTVAVGANGFIPKPFDLEELEATINRLCPPQGGDFIGVG